MSKKPISLANFHPIRSMLLAFLAGWVACLILSPQIPSVVKEPVRRQLKSHHAVHLTGLLETRCLGEQIEQKDEGRVTYFPGGGDREAAQGGSCCAEIVVPMPVAMRQQLAGVASFFCSQTLVALGVRLQI